MGSLVSVFQNKQRWMTTGRVVKLRDTGEECVEVVYGSADNDYEGSADLTIYMRKSVYDKVMSGEYSIKQTRTDSLVVLDKKGIPVRPIVEEYVY